MRSMPKIAPFERDEAAVQFALWLRDELKSRPPETKRIVAQIIGITENTLTNYTRGNHDGMPSFYHCLQILYALDGMQSFWTRLIGEDESLASQINAATALIGAVNRRMAAHPPSAEVDDAVDKLLKHARATMDAAIAARTEQKLRAVE